MKIFVGYGFNDRDKWIPDLVYPIIQAFGDEVITGEELQGDQITAAVVQKITESDALIGFLTRRGAPDVNGVWKTHRWVIEEIATAIAKTKRVVEVREAGADDQGGIAGDRQRIPYDENARDKCLVEVVKTIAKWHREETVKLKLLPAEFTQELFPIHKSRELRCNYRFLVDGVESPDIPTKIIPITGGLFVIAKNVPREALIQVQIEYRDRSWMSSFESTDSLGIHLQRGDI